MLPGLGDVLEVGRLAGKALAVLGILLLGPPPEIGRIGHERIGSLDHRQGIFRRTDDVGRPARPGGIFQRVARLALGSVHANRQGIIGHARAHQPIAATSASVPALQANSQSPAWMCGAAPMASATIVELGLTA